METVTTGPLKQNGYLVFTEAGSGVIIDPGSDPDAYRDRITMLGFVPKAIINTHGHFDHIGAVQDLCDEYEIPFYLHPADFALARRANLYRIAFKSNSPIRTPECIKPMPAAGLWKVLPGLEFDIMHTPGHTPGGVCFLIEDCLLSGDTLLGRGAGPTNLPGGDKALIVSSVDRLSQLGRGITVYPGHGRPKPLETFFSDDKKALP